MPGARIWVWIQGLGDPAADKIRGCVAEISLTDQMWGTPRAGQIPEEPEVMGLKISIQKYFDSTYRQLVCRKRGDGVSCNMHRTNTSQLEWNLVATKRSTCLQQAKCADHPQIRVMLLPDG
jgi:hypothetical protein